MLTRVKTRHQSLVHIFAKHSPIFKILSVTLSTKSAIKNHYRSQTLFSDINLSQGNVATPLRCSGIFVANFLLSVTVKEFWKLVNIWQSYGQQFGVLFFSTHGEHPKENFFTGQAITVTQPSASKHWWTDTNTTTKTLWCCLTQLQVTSSKGHWSKRSRVRMVTSP